MVRVEETIRDYLASDLSFVSSDLHLVGKEFKLTHAKVKGYIDILARDDDNNYVIIEIKRSGKAARETFNEIFKYIQLLKRELRVKDSEIRVILVSSEKYFFFPGIVPLSLILKVKPSTSSNLLFIWDRARSTSLVEDATYPNTPISTPPALP